MNSFVKSAGSIARPNSRTDGGHFDDIGRSLAHVRESQLHQPSDVHSTERVNRLPLAPAKSPASILLVDTALIFHDVHLEHLRSIPAIVDKLLSCADMYRHETRVYGLVMLVLHPDSKETAGAAHFVRRRWSTAKILLLARESAIPDDWLYDERLDPDLHPVVVRKAASRLLAEGRSLGLGIERN